jgi:hypothetical protein
MSAIPPPWLSSVIQSQGAQERAGPAKNAEAADDAKRTGQAAFSEKLRDAIENEDRDVEVYSDAEGTGSQGKPFSEAEEQRDEKEARDDEEAGSNLDIEA